MAMVNLGAIGPLIKLCESRSPQMAETVEFFEIREAKFPSPLGSFCHRELDGRQRAHTRLAHLGGIFASSRRTCQSFEQPEPIFRTNGCLHFLQFMLS